MRTIGRLCFARFNFQRTYFHLSCAHLGAHASENRAAIRGK